MPKTGENILNLGHPYDKNHLFICLETAGFPPVVTRSFVLGNGETPLFKRAVLLNQNTFGIYLGSTRYFTPILQDQSKNCTALSVSHSKLQIL